MKTLRGFTFIEIMVVVAIVFVLAAVAVVSLRAMSERLLLSSAAGDIAFALEEAKARAVAGRGGAAHGALFESGSYTIFEGETYDANDAGNVTHALDGRLELSTDILGSEGSVVFSRVTGAVGERVVITISLRGDPDRSRSIVVGQGGDISHGE